MEPGIHGVVLLSGLNSLSAGRIFNLDGCCFYFHISEASSFLTTGEHAAQYSELHTIEIVWINGDGKDIYAYLFFGSAEPLLISSVTIFEPTYPFVQNCWEINLTDIVLTHFQLLFPAGFFFGYDYPVKPFVHSFHPQLAISLFTLYS